MPKRPPTARPRPKPAPLPAAKGDRLTHRELRNTPGCAWERLANEEPLTLVADGEVKALVIPITDGNADRALESYQRGRALMAMQDIQSGARQKGTSSMSLAEINAIVRSVRKARR